MSLKSHVKCLTLVSSILLLALVGKSQTSPVIATQFPVTYTNVQTLFAGANPTFSVSVTNTPAVAYQWTFDNSPIDAATNASYTLTNAQIGNAGTYACVVTSSVGSVTNNGWTIAVVAAPIAPYPQAVLASDPVGYWRLNEGPDNGTGNQGAICLDYVGGNNGIYTNVLLDQMPGYSQLTEPTEPATIFGQVAANNSDANSIQGINFSAPAGSNSSFSVETWVNGAASQISGAGIVSKGFGGSEQFAMDDHSGFRFYIRSAGSTSYGAQSTIKPDGNWHHLVGVCDENNGAVSLYVDGKLAASVTILQGQGIRTVTNAVLIGARSSSTTSGNNYQFAGSIDDVAIYHHALTPTEVATHYFAVSQVPPSISQQPVAITNVALNGSVTVPVTVIGTTPLSYQWFDETTGGSVTGQTNSALTISNIVAADTYYLVATNAFGSITSSPVALTFKPVLLNQLPVTYTNVLTLFAGVSPTFSIAVSSVEPVTYQWFLNGAEITGATSASYTLTNAQADADGIYACVATSDTASITNAPLTVSVVPAPTAPYPQAVLAAKPIGYWRLNEGPDDGNGDQNAVCLDYVGGNNGIYTNMILAQLPGYSQSTEPNEPAAEFGETGYSLYNSDANSIQGIDFAAPTNTSSNFSIEAWVNGFTGQISGAGLVFKGTGGGGEQFAMDIYQNDFRFYIRDASGNSHDAQSTIQPDENWHHIVGVCNETAGTLTIYVDGVAAGGTTFSPGLGIQASSQPMLIGSRSSTPTSGNNYQFYGYMDDVAAYNYALTPAQIASHYMAVGGTIAPYLAPAPATTTNVAATATLTLPATVVGTPPIGYVWTNVTTGATLAGGSASTSSLDATLSYPNVPFSWNGDQLELIVTNAYGMTNSFVTVNVTSPVNAQPTNIVVTASSGQLTLQWPTDHTGWRLQAQTNNGTTGLTTNWYNVSGATLTNQIIVPVNPTNGSVFYRLVYP